MLSFFLRLAISGKFQTKFSSPYRFLVTCSLKSCVALFFWMEVWQCDKLCLLLSHKNKHEWSQGKRLSTSFFFSGRTCFWEDSILAACSQAFHNSQCWKGCTPARCSPSRGGITAGFHPPVSNAEAKPQRWHLEQIASNIQSHWALWAFKTCVEILLSSSSHKVIVF